MNASSSGIWAQALAFLILATPGNQLVCKYSCQVYPLIKVYVRFLRLERPEFLAPWLQLGVLMRLASFLPFVLSDSLSRLISPPPPSPTAPRESIPRSCDTASFVHSRAPVARRLGGEIITDVARAVRGPGRLDQHQALGWVVDVYYVHGVLIVVFAVLVGEDTLIVGWTQLEDHMAGMAEDAGFAVRALGRQNGLDLGYKVVEVEHRAGLHVL